MSEELEFENGLLSFANPNYQLDPADINSNLEAIEDFEDLYEELDTVCRYNRKSGIKSRRNYAQLDPESMGVKIDSETSQMLAADSDNNLKQTLNSSFSEKRYQKVDNDNTVIDSNDNEDVGRKSGFLDYYLSLEAASWPPKDPSPLLHNIQCSNTFSQLESSTAVQQQKELTVESEDGRNVQNIMSHFNNSIDDATSLSEKKNVSFRDQQMPSLCNIPCKHSTNHNNGKYVSHKDFKENDTLPSGWERHEDDSGPYYWHIGSGTIQREPPVICGSNDKIQSHSIKEIDMISSISDLSLHSCKSTSPILSVLSDARHVKPNPIAEGKLKRRSYPEGPRCPSSDKRPIRFAVRSLGWVEIAEDDLTPEKSSKAVNKCIVDLSMGRNDILDVVGRWGDGKDLFMDLDDYSLRLMSTQDLTILNTQPIHTIRVWGVGRDNGRDFAYVARDRVTRKYMCHVFRCDIPARIIANTLRDICKRIMIERSLQHSLAKQVGPVGSSLEINSENCGLGIPGPTRPTNLPTEQRRFLSTDCHSSCPTQSFPTPMEEPKKVLKVYYLGTRNVDKATGVEILNDAIEEISISVPPNEYKFVNVAVAPSTITISEPGDNGKMLAECRVRFLSFLGIGRNIKHCGFIVHTAQDQFVAHVFYCEPSSGALCKTIEAACKLRYQKCLDAHRQVSEKKLSESQGNKGFATTIRSFLGSIGRLTKSTET